MLMDNKGTREGIFKKGSVAGNPVNLKKIYNGKLSCEEKKEIQSEFQYGRNRIEINEIKETQTHIDPYAHQMEDGYMYDSEESFIYRTEVIKNFCLRDTSISETSDLGEFLKEYELFLGYKSILITELDEGYSLNIKFVLKKLTEYCEGGYLRNIVDFINIHDRDILFNKIGNVIDKEEYKKLTKVFEELYSYKKEQAQRLYEEIMF